MKSKIIVIIVCLCAIISCNQKTSKEELLAGKEYKYWVQVPNNWEDSILNRVSYFDRENKSIGYWYNTIRKHFYLPEFSDVFYYPYWNFINDTIIDIGTGLCKIITLTETDFVYDFRGEKFYYKAAPLDIIPEEYQKVQEIPEALRKLDDRY